MEFISKTFINSFLKEDAPFRPDKGEDILYDKPGYQTNMSGRFRFQKNMVNQRGRLILTTHRIYFKGIASGSMGGGGAGNFSGGSDIEILYKNISKIERGRFSAPQRILSLGLAKPIAGLLDYGYVTLETKRGAEYGFFCPSPDSVIRTVNTHLKSK